MVFKPGQSGNPNGSQANVKRFKDKLNKQFVRALTADFEEHGVKAISDVRKKDPASYIRVIAGLLPKEYEINNKIGELTDEQLDELIVALQAGIGAGLFAQASRAEEASEQAEVLPTIQ